MFSCKRCGSSDAQFVFKAHAPMNVYPTDTEYAHSINGFCCADCVKGDYHRGYSDGITYRYVLYVRFKMADTALTYIDRGWHYAYHIDGWFVLFEPEAKIYWVVTPQPEEG